jgi:uncharacterized protein (DUF1778 family)
MKTQVVGIRVSVELYKLLSQVSDARGECIADFVRRSILKELATLSFLPAEQKKALGVQVTERE